MNSGVSAGPGRHTAGDEADGGRIMARTAAIVAVLLLFGVFLLLRVNYGGGGPFSGVVLLISAPILVPLFVALVVVVSAWAAEVAWLIHLWLTR